MKKQKAKKIFLEELSKTANVSIAASKAGVSRNTPYRWKKEDIKFLKLMEEALWYGDESVDDLAQSKLISKIHDGNIRAIIYRLDRKERRQPKTAQADKKLSDKEIAEANFQEFLNKPLEPHEIKPSVLKKMNEIMEEKQKKEIEEKKKQLLIKRLLGEAY